ncbi:MAG: hypothetical protein AB7Q81_22765 [Gammaproteobacteria bacterium]
MSDSEHPLLAHASARTWIEAGGAPGLRPGADRARKLEWLAQYCAYVEADPDRIIAAARGDAATKNDYLKRLKAWADGLPGSERARHDAENAIRGFFMRNGFRVVARPYRDVYQRRGS